MTRPSSDALMQAYLQACECELKAFKPGNVSVYSEGHEMTVADFRRSAAASAPRLCDPRLSLGEKIYWATWATREAVDCNTNLGILLLAAPLITACQIDSPEKSLRGRLTTVLDNSTREDADWVYRAIRVASPGGLGRSAEQDVNSAPEVTLKEAMAIASGWDRIAYQYVNAYADVFDLAIPRYHYTLSQWGDEEWATVAVFATLLKQIPDSHIERKFGNRYTRMVAERMGLVEQTLSRSARAEPAIQLLRDVDTEFKSAGINPGTTADLTVACLLTVRLETLLSEHAQ